MTDSAQIGKNKYKEALRRGRKGTHEAREALRQIVENSPGPQTLAALVTRIAVSVGAIEAVLSELDEIGRTAKNLK